MGSKRPLWPAKYTADQTIPLASTPIRRDPLQRKGSPQPLFTCTRRDQLGGAHLVVTSYGFWNKYLSGDSSIKWGNALTLSGIPYTVIGVMHPGFELPRVSTQVIKQKRLTRIETSRPPSDDPTGAFGSSSLTAFWSLSASVLLPRSGENPSGRNRS